MKYSDIFGSLLAFFIMPFVAFVWGWGTVKLISYLFVPNLVEISFYNLNLEVWFGLVLLSFSFLNGMVKNWN